VHFSGHKMLHDIGGKLSNVLRIGRIVIITLVDCFSEVSVAPPLEVIVDPLQLLFEPLGLIFFPSSLKLLLALLCVLDA
jgi:hypothetical protein